MRINSIAARMDYENGVAEFERAYAGIMKNGVPINVKDEFLLTQSDLRLEQPLVANNNLYNFPVMVNIQSQGGTQFNTEIRLNNQDTFLPQYFGFYLANPTSATDTTFRLHTWANPAVFTNATQMQAIYNGNLKVGINNRNYITKWMMSRHMVINQTQQTAAFGAGSPVDQYDGSSDGLFPTQPYVIISGSSNMSINVELPAAPTAVDEFSRLVMVIRGIIAYNSTVTT